MKYFGTSGVTGHGISTFFGAVVTLATVAGFLSQEQSAAITTALPTVTAGITSIMGVLALFYKGHPASPCPPYPGDDTSEDKV